MIRVVPIPARTTCFARVMRRELEAGGPELARAAIQMATLVMREAADDTSGNQND